MAFLKYTPEDLRFAKKAGFKKKKPKKPKRKTFNNIKSYESRYNSWVTELKARAKEGRSLDKMKDDLRNV